MALETIAVMSVLLTAGYSLGYCVEVLMRRECAGCGDETHGTYCPECLERALGE